MPRRLVFELTNLCNLNCVMCGRNAADFKPTLFDMEWFYKLEPLCDTIEEVKTSIFKFSTAKRSASSTLLACIERG